MAGLHEPKTHWGQLWGAEGGPRKRGCTPLWQQDRATPRNHQAQDVPPCRRTVCPWTDGLDGPTLCCCWERDKHWFGCTVVVRKGEKASLQGTGGLSLQEGAGLDWALPQLLCGMAAGSGGSVGQQCHPALPKSPSCCFPVGLGVLQLTRGRESLGDHPSPGSSLWQVPQGTSCTGAGICHELGCPRLGSSPSEPRGGSCPA